MGVWEKEGRKSMNGGKLRHGLEVEFAGSKSTKMQQLKRKEQELGGKGMANG